MNIDIFILNSLPKIMVQAPVKKKEKRKKKKKEKKKETQYAPPNSLQLGHKISE